MRCLFFILLASSCSLGYCQKNKFDTLFIQTSALCQDCKQRIESSLNNQRGVKYAELDLDTKVAICVYRPAKNTASCLRLAVAKVGYDADDVKAYPEAVLLLPKCCQPGGH
ncbi:MAG: heavy-metal-associated domain-containing protein [Bacteroidetes bacterium]|nr:heavy-metal-associated domain-containing protein [Bacteroidota bacterium]MBM3425166.1 heavy-metal-associated domain-containing protein [Bacteroidota bacterium]